MRPKTPITKEAKEFLQSKLNRMSKLEKDKTIKRLEMYDRGYKAKELDYDLEVERGD